ncbi:unnamed protein product, partial [Rotaria sp. Silwood1]
MNKVLSIIAKRPRGSGEASSEQSTAAPKEQETEEKPHGHEH